MTGFRIELPHDAPGWFDRMNDFSRGIVLRRGYVMRGSELHRWCSAGSAAARTTYIYLLNEHGDVTATWTLAGAVPVRSVIVDDTMDKVIVEEIEFRYDSMTQS